MELNRDLILVQYTNNNMYYYLLECTEGKIWFWDQVHWIMKYYYTIIGDVALKLWKNPLSYRFPVHFDYFLLPA